MDIRDNNIIYICCNKSETVKRFKLNHDRRLLYYAMLLNNSWNKFNKSVLEFLILFFDDVGVNKNF